jgi:hypothetical protein
MWLITATAQTPSENGNGAILQSTTVVIVVVMTMMMITVTQCDNQLIAPGSLHAQPRNPCTITDNTPYKQFDFSLFPYQYLQ